MTELGFLVRKNCLFDDQVKRSVTNSEHFFVSLYLGLIGKRIFPTLREATLPLAQVWGGASADGMRFVTPVRTINAGPNRKYFGHNRGSTWYNFISDQYSGFHGIVTLGTLSEKRCKWALFGKRIYGHSHCCNTDFDDKWACLNLSGV